MEEVVRVFVSTERLGSPHGLAAQLLGLEHPVDDGRPTATCHLQVMEEENALFTGDHIMGWSTSVITPPDGDMAAYMRSMQRLVERDDAIHYPAHGEPVKNPQRLARSMMGHRKHREGQILRQVEAKGPVRIEDMVPEMYKGVDPALHPAAGRSVLAHLIDLEARGAVRREGELWRLAA